jgi:VWFA-related protein
MRRPYCLRVLIACLVALALARPGRSLAQQTPPREPTPVFPSEAELVVVDVVVADKKGGGAVAGLSPADFEITEDGAPQTISSFEAATAPPPPAPAPAGTPAAPSAPDRVSTNTAPDVRAGRSFVLVFDDANITPLRVGAARAAVAEFLRKGVRDGDRVLLVATSGSAWWSTRIPAGREELLGILERLEARFSPDTGPERMSDSEAMRIHVYRDMQVWDRVTRRYETYGVSAAAMRGDAETRLPGTGDAYVEARAQEVYTRAIARLDGTLSVLERVLGAMAPVKGRKSLLLVSEGFIYDPSIAGFRRVTQASRRSNVALYFVDARGLEGSSSVFSAEFGPPIADQDVLPTLADQWEGVSGAQGLAAETGGFSIRNTNALAPGLERIARESEAYYLLGYQPRNAAQDGKFRKIEVKVARRGVDVRARRGYYAPGPPAAGAVAKAGGRDEAIQAALDSPYEIDGVPLRATSFVFEEAALGKAAVVIATDVDIRGLAFEKQEERLEDALEFLLVVAHRETGEFHRYDQTVELKLQPETLDRYSRSWFPLRRDFELAPGGYQAKIVVRDRRSRKVGSVVHDFSVPPLDAFRVSTPVLSNVIEPRSASEPGPPVPVVQVDRTFPAQGILYLQFAVFGAAPSPVGDRLPRVRAEYVVRRSDGAAFSRARPSLILPTSLGELARVSGMSLDGAAPGEYELVLQLEDEITEKRLEVKERFRVVAAEGS